MICISILDPRSRKDFIVINNKWFELKHKKLLQSQYCYEEIPNIVFNKHNFIVIPYNGSLMDYIVYFNRVYGKVKCGDRDCLFEIVGSGDSTKISLNKKYNHPTSMLVNNNYPNLNSIYFDRIGEDNNLFYYFIRPLSKQ